MTLTAKQRGMSKLAEQMQLAGTEVLFPLKWAQSQAGYDVYENIKYTSQHIREENNYWADTIKHVKREFLYYHAWLENVHGFGYVAITKEEASEALHKTLSAQLHNNLKIFKSRFLAIKYTPHENETLTWVEEIRAACDDLFYAYEPIKNLNYRNSTIDNFTRKRITEFAYSSVVKGIISKHYAAWLCARMYRKMKAKDAELNEYIIKFILDTGLDVDVIDAFISSKATRYTINTPKPKTDVCYFSRVRSKAPLPLPVRP